MQNLLSHHLYVNRVELNGQHLNRRYLTYTDITTGGKLGVFMDDKPDK